MRKSELVLILSVCMISTQCASWERWGPEWESKQASKKLDSLWQQIQQYSGSGKFSSRLELLGIFLESMQPSLQWVGDTFKVEQNGKIRRKYIHSVGNVAKVKFIPNPENNEFTGLFNEGADYGLIRLSLAKKPDPSKSSADGAVDNHAPGFGLKFLRDGIPSANLVAMYSVNGQNSWNFFAKNFTTKIKSAEGPVLKALQIKFETATPIASHVGTSDWATYTQNGTKIQNPIFPYYLIFEPNPTLQTLFSDSYTTDFQSQLATITPGTVLYSVYGVPEPNATPKLIGTIQTTTHLVPSKFGYDYLFFKHQDILDDFKIRPDWNPTGQPTRKKCPFSK